MGTGAPHWCNIALHCTALQCTALHCTALHCTALHCTTLHCTALRYTTLHSPALHSTTLLCSALHFTCGTPPPLVLCEHSRARPILLGVSAVPQESINKPVSANVRTCSSTQGCQHSLERKHETCLLLFDVMVSAFWVHCMHSSSNQLKMRTFLRALHQYGR